jgi:hypothetical protein
MTTPPRESTVPVVGASVERVERKPFEPMRYIVRRFYGRHWMIDMQAESIGEADRKAWAEQNYPVEIIDTRPPSPPAQAPQGGADTKRAQEALIDLTSYAKGWALYSARQVGESLDDADRRVSDLYNVVRLALAQKPEAREVPEAAIKYAIDILDLREDTLRRGPNGQDAESNADYARGMADELRAFLGGDGAKGASGG